MMMTDNSNHNPNYKARPRPLSPHLQVYKPQLTSMLSIFHRASIIAMFFGVLGLVLILADYAFVEHCACAAWLKESETGKLLTKLVLSAYAFIASYWICATIRHFFWDMGMGFHIKTAYRTAYISMLSTVVLAALIIYYGIL